MDMVVRCRDNAAKRGVAPQVIHQRVEDLSLERRYASIYFAGPTFNLLADDETAIRALRAIRSHLTDDGAALIPLWVPDPTPDDELGVSERPMMLRASSSGTPHSRNLRPRPADPDHDVAL